MNWKQRFQALFSCLRQVNSKSASVLLTNDASLWLDDRNDACQLLEQANIAFAIWLEALLVHFGSDTVLFDMNSLVHDPGLAAEVLRQSGYRDTAADEGLYFMPKAFCGTRLKLANNPTTVVLHSADTWHVSSLSQALPPLHQFLDALMDVWLQIPIAEYGVELGFGLHVFCWIMYCYKLQDSDQTPVNSIEYAKFLKSEHRELHYDIVEKPNYQKRALAGSASHSYHVRRAQDIRNGDFEPQPYEEKLHQVQLPVVTE